MSRIVIASLRKNAGKTSLIVGMAGALKKRFSYMKPIGDRLIYRKKQLWDYDSALLVGLFGLDIDAQKITLGFEQSKLRFMYDQPAIETRLREMVEVMEHGKDWLILEGGKDIAYGSSVRLDAISLAAQLAAGLIIVLDGDENAVLDDAAFIKSHLTMPSGIFRGVVINKISNLDDFKEAYASEIENLGIPILGMIPYEPELNHLTVGFLAEKLLAKVLTGEVNLTCKVKNILIGSMTGEQLLRNHLIKKENKLIVTSGDRTDMLLVALQEDAVAVVLTNNVLPPAKIISQFEQQNVPLLLTQPDTWSVANQLSELEPLLTKDEPDKVKKLADLISEHVNLKAVTG